MKTCRRGLHQFDGKNCKECQRAGHRAWLAANKHHVQESQARWIAANRERYDAANRKRVREWKERDPEKARLSARACYARNRDAYLAKGRERYHRNAEQNRAKALAWRKANPEKAAAIAKRKKLNNPEKYRALAVQVSHRRRARERGVGCEPITAEHLRLLFEAQEGRCRYCRVELSGRKHLDHRIPIARGGPHAPSNVCWSCPTCNHRKNAKTEAEFLAEIAA